MFISLFVFGFAETHCATNHMIFGAIVDILRVGTAFHDSYPKERLESKKAVGIEHTKERARNLP